MSGLFGVPKQKVVPTVNTSDTANRLNDALARRLASGGSNADQTSTTSAPTGGARQPTLTGLN